MHVVAVSILTYLMLVTGKIDIMESVNSCRVCHSDINTKYQRSIHSQIKINCTFCHGGDASDFTFSSMSRAKGFKGKISRSKIPLLCAECHSNSEMMLQYGNFFDQYRIYTGSQHGKLLRNGDTKVAVCTDCHGVHDISKVSEPDSSANWRNIPQTCARCHSDQNYMKQYGIPVGQFEQYRGSIHGILRLEKGDMHSPGCPDCHGSHGAVPPGVREVENICGRCHVLQQKNFMLSPHHDAFAKKKFKECTTCHGSHGIKQVDISLFMENSSSTQGKGCFSCHGEGSQERKVAEEIVKIFKELKEKIEIAERMTSIAQQKGFDVDEEKVKIDEAYSRFNEFRPVTHTLSMELIREKAEDVEVLTGDVQEMVEAKLIEWRDRRVTLAINIIIFLAVIILLYIIRRRMLKNGI